MNRMLLSLVPLAMLGLSAPAHAAMIDYRVGGTLTDGTVFTGSFTLDDTKTALAQFSNTALDVAGSDLDTLKIVSTDRTSFYTLVFGANTSNALFYLGLYAQSDPDYRLLNVRPGALDAAGTFYSPSGGANVFLSSGTIALAQPSAVPEPGSWALMILGFAAAGVRARSHRPSFKRRSPRGR